MKKERIEMSININANNVPLAKIFYQKNGVIKH